MKDFMKNNILGAILICSTGFVISNAQENQSATQEKQESHIWAENTARKILTSKEDFSQILAEETAYLMQEAKNETPGAFEELFKHIASYFGREATSFFLIAKNANARTRALPVLSEAFAGAAGHGQLETVKFFLDKNDQEVRTQALKGIQDGLSWAAENCHDAIIKYLLNEADEDIQQEALKNINEALEVAASQDVKNILEENKKRTVQDNTAK